MNIPQRLVLAAALIAGQIAIGYCTSVHAEGIIATSRDSFGTELQLSDVQVPFQGAICNAARGIPPRHDEEMVPACWSPRGPNIEVLYLLHGGVTFEDTIPSSEFRLTDYGMRVQGGGL